MIKYLLVFILLSTPCLAGMGIGGFPCPGPGMVIASAPPTCGTLTFSGTPGDTETFENAEGSFCTGSTFSETDAGSNISTFNTSQYHGGAHSLSIAAVGTAPNNRVVADLGAGEDSYTISFWFRAPASNDWSNTFIFSASGTPGNIDMMPIMLRNQGASFNLLFYDYLGGSGAGTSNYADGAWYKVVLDVTRNAVSTLKLYDSSSSLLETLTRTSINYPARYFIFTSGSEAGDSIYFDDIQYNSTNP